MRWARPARLAASALGDARLVVAVVGLGLALLRFDFSLNVALPAIGAALGENLSGVQWAIAVYLLSQVALLPVCGALSDRLGHRTTYLAGLAFFTVASVVCAMAGTLPHLLAGRGFQGVGAALLLASAPALIVATLPSEQRGRALGYVGATQAAGQIAGPTIGGLLVDLFGWQAIFTVRVPVGVVLLLLSLVLLPKTVTRRGEPLDNAGAVTLGIGATALLFGLSRVSSQGLGLEVLTSVSVGLAALVLFVWIERRAVRPMLPLRLLRSPRFATMNLAWVLAWTAVFGIWLVFPFFLARALGLAAGPAGVLLAIVAVGMTLAPVPFGAWADRFGPRVPGIVGMVLILAGLALLARLDSGSPWPLVALALALVGSGIGGFQSPNNALIMQAVGPRELGVGSGVVALGRNLGVVTGVVFASTILSVRESAHRAAEAGGPVSELGVFVHAHQDTFIAATALMIVALAVYLWGIRLPSVQP